MSQNLQTTLRSNTRKTNTRSRVNAKTFVDASIEVGEAFDLLGSCDQLIFCIKLFIELFVEFVLSITGRSEVEENCANRALWED